MKKIYLSLREDSMPLDKIAKRVLKFLVEDQEQYVILSFPLNEKTKGAYSQKTIAILRIVNDMVVKKGGYFNKLLSGENEKKYIVKNSLPSTKNEINERINVAKGYGDIVKVHEIKLWLEETKNDLEEYFKDCNCISLSTKEDAKSAGSAASFILRSLLVDQKPCKLRFVLSATNSEKMCEKALAVERIMKRMLKDPGCIIHSSLPSTPIKYEIEAVAPILKKLPIETRKENYVLDIDESKFVVAHEILFFAK